MSAKRTTIGDHQERLEGRTIKFVDRTDWPTTYLVHRYAKGTYPDSTLYLRTTQDGSTEHTFSVQDTMLIDFVDDVDEPAES